MRSRRMLSAFCCPRSEASLKMKVHFWPAGRCAAAKVVSPLHPGKKVSISCLVECTSGPLKLPVLKSREGPSYQSLMTRNSLTNVSRSFTWVNTEARACLNMMLRAYTWKNVVMVKVTSPCASGYVRSPFAIPRSGHASGTQLLTWKAVPCVLHSMLSPTTVTKLYWSPCRRKTYSPTLPSEDQVSHAAAVIHSKHASVHSGTRVSLHESQLTWPRLLRADK
mmetsp:Transcript_54996/g.167145  ORF Transcript_54996/g.167145 Transcript_54996/m.167145 type:complete len:222 (+) Transcript_54996:521-1186(+)